MVHAEMNAILNAKDSLKGCTLYTWPFFTCHRCAPHVIQVGIKSVISRVNNNNLWEESIIKADQMYQEVGITRILM